VLDQYSISYPHSHVADFLKVNRLAGLSYFDASFRPVPFEQHSIGVKSKTVSARRGNLDVVALVAFERVREMLEQDHRLFSA
jgi:antiviral helicase SLH1